MALLTIEKRMLRIGRSRGITPSRSDSVESEDANRKRLDCLSSDRKSPSLFWSTASWQTTLTTPCIAFVGNIGRSSARAPRQSSECRFVKELFACTTPQSFSAMTRTRNIVWTNLERPRVITTKIHCCRAWECVFDMPFSETRDKIVRHLPAFDQPIIFCNKLYHRTWTLTALELIIMNVTNCNINVLVITDNS